MTVLAVAAASFAAASPASAATRYAEPSSSDQVGSCSSLKPCRLDHAVSGASAGDVVVVRRGTYSIDYPVVTGSAITIRGVGGRPRPRVVGGTVEMTGGGHLRHLYLEAPEAIGSALEIEGVVARDLDLTGAVELRDSSRGTLLSDTVVRGTTQVKDGKSDGSVELLNVTIHASDTGLKVKQTGTSGTVVRNSIIRGDAEDISIQKGAKVAVDHSNLRSSGSGGWEDRGGNENGDPLFADAAAGDLRLLRGSTAIDAGTAADGNLGVADPDGFKRTIGDAPDMGAYEYVPPGTPDALAPVEEEPADTPSGNGSASGDLLDPPAPPRPGRRMGVDPVKGSVRVRPPGGSGFVDLGSEASVPIGSVVDASNGVVELTTARDASGEPQTGRFWGGRFKVTQRQATGNYTELALRGGDFGACPKPGVQRKLSAAPKRRRVRQLWGNDNHGRFRTRGRGGHATVRGTRWLTRDRCDGTLFKVTEGAIDVKPKGKHRVRLQVGERMLAKLRG